MKNSNHISVRLLCFLLTLCTLLSFASCGNDTTPTTGKTAATTGATTPSTPSIPDGYFVPSQEYVLIRGDAHIGSTDLSDATACVRDALETVYGIDAMLDDDYIKVGAEQQFNPYEIIIGETNRPQSKAALEDLGVNDYTYFVESEQVIVICGGSPAATLQAAQKFCADVLEYDGENSKNANTPVEIGATYTYHAQYPCSAVTLNSAPLSDYKIVVNGMSALDTAFGLVRALGAYTGERIPVVTRYGLTGNEKNLILVGAEGRNAKPLSLFNGYTYRVEQDALGTLISLNSNGRYYGRLLQKLTSLIEETVSNGIATLTLDEADVVYYGVEDHIPAWNLQSQTGYAIADGIEYTEQLYYDDSGLPYRTYVLTIDPNKVNFYLGTSNDGYEYALDPDERQNTKEHMQAAVANGKNIIAAVNAGFFAIHTDYSPAGTAIKDGQKIGKTVGNAFFAVTVDGKIIIDDGKNYKNYDESQFYTAVAGSAILLLDGKLTGQATAADTHPRTLVGIKEDGTVIIGVIDGRQPTHSNGASLARCALWMKSLGAMTVLNLDGGGSSTFITRDPEADTYTVHNSPSDGTLRKIHNSLMIAPKKQEE